MSKKTGKKYQAIYYPPISRAEHISTILNGLATGLSCIFLTLNPMAVYWWLVATVYKNTSDSKGTLALMIICGVCTLLGLVPSIAAKVINRKSKWAVINIVVISVCFAVAFLLTLGFVALITKVANEI